MALRELLRRDQQAAAVYETLHPSVKEIVDSFSENIQFDEDLYAIANNAMTERLQDYGALFDDGDTWPD